MPVFGLLKRGGKVYTKVIADAPAALIPVINHKILADPIVYIDVSRLHQCVLIIANCLLTKLTTSIAWKTSGTKQNVGCVSRVVSPQKLPLFLKEGGFRSNDGPPKQQIKLLPSLIKPSLYLLQPLI